MDVHPLSLKPGDQINGRLVVKVTSDPKSKNYVLVTYDDGATVRLRSHNLTYRQIPRIERPGSEGDTYLPKIPAGWGKH